MAELSKIINRQMAEKKVSPVQIAAFVGVSQRMVEYYIKGTKYPRFQKLLKLSQFLDFNINELAELQVPELKNITKKITKEFRSEDVRKLEEQWEVIKSGNYIPVRPKIITILVLQKITCR